MRAKSSRPPIRVVIVTMDTHLAVATASAAARLLKTSAGLQLEMHCASEYAADAQALERARAAITQADILVVTMLFLEEHYLPVIDLIRDRREDFDALLCAMSASEVVKLTRLGRFDMSKPASGPLALLKRLRGGGRASEEGTSGRNIKAGAGASQMRMLRRLPKILRFIPGTAQDVRSYFLGLQYWLGGSEDNMVNLTSMLVSLYAQGPRAEWKGSLTVDDPLDYPDLGVYHPRMKSRLSATEGRLPRVNNEGRRVGLLLLRSYLLAGNTAHYDGVISALEARGLSVVPAFAMGLDSRPAIDAFFMKNGKATVDAVVSLTGFSLVGGPAYNDAEAAEETLAGLSVPYLAAHPLEFQTLAQWGGSDRGLMPVESTIMVAIPELDGATSPMVFGGRPGVSGVACQGCHRGCTFESPLSPQNLVSCPERADLLADRIERLVSLRRKKASEKQVAVVLFNFPPNGGSVGTAAHLAVFESLMNLLKGLQNRGYRLEMPASAQALRTMLLEGNRQAHASDANVLARLPVADYMRVEAHLSEIEACWGPAPGKHLTDGRNLFIQGVSLGAVSIMLQPGFGYEGDPMRLLYEKGHAPTHAFAAFYRYIRSTLKADALVHFGTHGALEFMPGKQAGMSGACWPERLVGEIPHFYVYAANNPSEGTMAKRRAGATLVSYLTPALSEAGLYRGLEDLRSSLARWGSLSPRPGPEGIEGSEAESLALVIAEQAAALDMTFPGLKSADGSYRSFAELDAGFLRLSDALEELQGTLIPMGLHVLGQGMSEPERLEMLMAMTKACAPGLDDTHSDTLAAAARATLLGETQAESERAAARILKDMPGAQEMASILARAEHGLRSNQEIEAILHALEGRFVRPAPGGDLLRTPDILPTGRNLHGFDPFRIPSRSAWLDGALQAEKLLARYAEDGKGFPESVAMVLWGTDNLKTEGSPIAQAMSLMGAKPRFDGFGRLAGASLVSLEELGRPRIDVVMTLSGIFRDLLPLQIRMLAEAAFLAASADEPPELNPIRRHALAYMEETGVDLETAALRVYGNADGAYGANVNHLIEQGIWQNEDELASCYATRKGFAYGRKGQPLKQPQLLESSLRHVSLAYQNLESLETGLTSVDTYFDTLGGISRLIRKAKGGEDAPVYIGDQTSGRGVVRSLSEQVALESRTRMLNPKWYESMLEHGYEGVRQIEVHLTNTMGWSATTGQVQPWVYQQTTQTFLADEAMRDRLAELNPAASAKLAGRLLEAFDRQYWNPDPETLETLRRAGELFEDRLEGVTTGASA